MCDGTRAAQERWKIVGERILCTGNTGSGNEIEKTGGTGGNFREAFVGRGWRAEEDGVEMVSSENALIVGGFFGSEVGSEDAIGAGGCGSRCEFFEAHLEDGIVVAEEDKRDFVHGRVRLANAANEIEDAGQRGTGFQSALRGTLNGGAVGEGIAEGHAKLDDVGAGFGKREDKLQRGIERGIARSDVSDDAKFAGGAQLGKTLRDASRTGGFARHEFLRKTRA